MKKIIRNLYLMSFLLLICSLTGCRSAPVFVPNQTEVTIFPYEEITEEAVYDFHDIMGFKNGYCSEVLSPGGQILRYYNAKTKTGESLIAHTFGFPNRSADFFLDIDNDGMREIIANVTYGDGAQRVEVWRWRLRDGSVEVGQVDYSLYEDAGAIYRSIKEIYDPTQGRILISFNSNDMCKTITWEWNDFSHFSFTPLNRLRNP